MAHADLQTPGPHTPSSARISNLWLGGSWHTPADEAAAAELEQICPAVRQMAADSRLFGARVTGWAASELRISQFLDLGAGASPGPPAAQVARSVRPGAKVAYIDNDPEAADWLADVMPGGSGEGIAVACTDLGRPAEVLSHPALAGVIDATAPVAVLFGLVLHFWPPEDAAAIVAGYARLLAPGSVVAVSVPRVDDDLMWRRLAAVYPVPAWNFTPAEVLAAFEGLELVNPGVGAAFALRPGRFGVPCRRKGPAYVLAAIGRKR